MAESFLNFGSPPTTRAAAGLSPNASDSQGRYVSGVEIRNGVIIMEYGNSAHQQINGQYLTITPYETYDVRVVWRCGNAPAPADTRILGSAGGVPTQYIPPSVANQYLPSACRP